ncbi:MAG: dTDP-4-dehydrorhamnose reductase [Planctomycetes bacterium]|nr:dTDP-4-dehydrorhamnose reductase [Planctomycetota bacterium]
MSASLPRILLIGAGGQLGRELLETLCPLGSITPTVHRPTHAPELAEARTLDLADGHQVRAAIREVRPALIINAAAYTAVDLAETERDACWQINAIAPGWLAEEAAALGAALIHYSTDYVFNGSGTQPWREDDSTGPLNQYGASKLAGEEAIRQSGVSHLILRTSWVYGAYGKNFVATMLRHGLTKKQLRIVSDQVGAPTSADWLAEATRQILAQATVPWHDWLATNGGVFHAACAGETNWHAFALEIFRRGRALGLPLVVEDVAAVTSQDYPTPARRPLNSRLFLARLRERFGIEPPEWRTALARTLPAIAHGIG